MYYPNNHTATVGVSVTILLSSHFFSVCCLRDYSYVEIIFYFVTTSLKDLFIF